MSQIDDDHGDGWLDKDVKESEWLTNQSYQDANKGPIE
jgi:hypothetical protein